MRDLSVARHCLILAKVPRINGSFFGAGDPITHVARIVGYATFALEHLVFGMALGLVLFALRRSPIQAKNTTTRESQRSSAGTPAGT